MKNILILLFLALTLNKGYAQTDKVELFRQLYKEEKFNEIIKYKLEKDEVLSAKALYYVGMAHYMKSQDADAAKYLDKAINTGPADFDMYYYRGMVHFYANNFKESINYFDTAITLLPNEPDYHLSRGDAFYALNNIDSALVSFERASILPKCNNRVYSSLGEIYQQKNLNEKALNSYFKSLSILSKSDENYQRISYNIAVIQVILEQYKDAQKTLEQHIQLYPTDYSAVIKLIQAYNSLELFHNADSLKKIIYKAHIDKKLPESSSKMFCFNQFIWNGKRVMAFEVFDEPKEYDLFVKHHFYVIGADGEVEYKIDSETSIAMKMDKGKKYVLCLKKGGSYQTFWNYRFNDDYNYAELKNAVLNILDGKVKPQGSTTIKK